MEEELKCSETDEEPAKVTTERQFRLVCNIQGGAGSAVQIAHLHEGIKMGLTGQVSYHNH
jgi:putative NIF3 family GTP cyclohydrolase 1 type 2